MGYHCKDWHKISYQYCRYACALPELIRLKFHMRCPGHQSGHEFIQTRCIELLHSGLKFLTLEKMLLIFMVHTQSIHHSGKTLLVTRWGRTLRRESHNMSDVTHLAFWNRWTLGLDFGPGNAGLWTDISGNIGPKTHKISCIHVLFLDLCVSRLRILHSSDKCKIFRPETHRSKVIYRGPNSVCFWAEISVQSPAFPGPKSRPRVQRFQNACCTCY